MASDSGQQTVAADCLGALNYLLASSVVPHAIQLALIQFRPINRFGYLLWENRYTVARGSARMSTSLRVA